MKPWILALVGLLLGCQAEASSPLVVFAASSLTDAFVSLAGAFEQESAGRRVELQFAGSQTLATQIELGARADVFAAANPEDAMRLRDLGLTDSAVPFASNHLVLLVSQRAAARSFEELPSIERVVLGTPEVPVGRYADTLLLQMDAQRPGFSKAVLAHVVSRENNARLVRAKVEIGEADAAIVYRSDALGRPQTRVLNAPAGSPVATYVAARVRESDHADAHAFVAFLESPKAQQTLQRLGFAPP